eukprot:CAMPEP_0182441522 /NCGR_PEP_ID=MMETSP1172-20130603/499_1 /TAXON_ID=708627 /ORGANISM="Timspurckia oligopyrenoides, Strain CCMP3278" /LENGTH=546 /DNA_ID=CAMNT_0024635865 /DNA_START=60 /DNA_END=1700 /DNA_ORIENTATION=+
MVRYYRSVVSFNSALYFVPLFLIFLYFVAQSSSSVSTQVSAFGFKNRFAKSVKRPVPKHLDNAGQLQLKAPFHRNPDYSIEDPRILRDFDLLGSAILALDPDTKRDVIRLTPQQPDTSGLIHTHEAIAIGNERKAQLLSLNFQVSFDFTIRSSPHSKFTADGLGLFYSLNKPKLGAFMGMREDFVGIGIIVDSFRNSLRRRSKDPYVYAVVNDGGMKYDASGDGLTQQVTPGCYVEADVRTRLIVNFHDSRLNVKVERVGANHSPYTCFTADVELRDTAHSSPVFAEINQPHAHLGYFTIASQTGQFFSEHDVSHFALHIEDDLRNGDIPIIPFSNTHNQNNLRQESSNRGRVVHEPEVSVAPQESMSPAVELREGLDTGGMNGVAKELGMASMKELDVILSQWRKVSDDIQSFDGAAKLRKRSERASRAAENAKGVTQAIASRFDEVHSEMMQITGSLSSILDQGNRVLDSLNTEMKVYTQKYLKLSKKDSFDPITAKSGKRKTSSKSGNWKSIVMIVVFGQIIVFLVLALARMEEKSRSIARFN